MKNIQLTINPGLKESAHTVRILLEGELLLKHLHDVVEEVKSAVTQYEDITVLLQNVTHIDLACIQLLFSIKQSAHKTNKKFACQVELPADAQNVLANSGIANLAALLTK